ncbi:MAG: transposase [Thermoplasmata archaeon]
MGNNIKIKFKYKKYRIPKYCICPACGMKQKFKKERENWKTVKDINFNNPMLLKVRVIYAKCLNTDCKVNSFRLPTPGIEKYARATERLKNEVVAGIVQDNSTCPRISKRISRSFNTTGSKSTVDRWKHQEADKYRFEDIIPRLGFSGILCIDGYKPKRTGNYDLIASDGKTTRILYIDEAGGLGRGWIEEYLIKIRDFGIKPLAIIFDMAVAFPGKARKVFPGVVIQHDYFHVMKKIYWHLRNALAEYRMELKEQGQKEEAMELWYQKWRILKNLDKWDKIDFEFMEPLLERYKGTVVEDIVILKEQIQNIFNDSKTKQEAYERRRALIDDHWEIKNEHFANIIKFLNTSYFDYMITYLEYPELSRSGNSETVIRVWRQMEKVRYGFKTLKGRQDHLKLYQVSKYLGGKYI